MKSTWAASLLVPILAGSFLVLSQLSQSEEPGESPAQQEPPPQVAQPPEERDDDDQDGGHAAPWACPLFPLMTDPGGTLYYCDRYDEEDCDDAVEAAYVYGDYNWPYAGCGHPHCLGEARFTGLTSFPGLKDHVPTDYDHRWPESDELMSGQIPGETCIPGGPARRCCKVVRSFNRRYMAVTYRGATIHAKILQFLYSRKIGLGDMSGHDPSEDPSAEKFYIAFEMAGPFGQQVIGENVKDLGEYSKHAFHCNAEVLPGELHRVLVLMKTRP